MPFAPGNTTPHSGRVRVFAFRFDLIILLGKASRTVESQQVARVWGCNGGHRSKPWDGQPMSAPRLRCVWTLLEHARNPSHCSTDSPACHLKCDYRPACGVKAASHWLVPVINICSKSPFLDRTPMHDWQRECGRLRYVDPSAQLACCHK